MGSLDWKDILSIRINDAWGLSLHMGPLLLIAASVTLGWFIIRMFIRGAPRANWRVVEGEVELGGLGRVTIRPSYEDRQIAHQAWVELATRKAGLLFDEDHDVIVEVYDSWYQLFREMRALARQIPAEKVATREDTRKIVRLLIGALNDGLRPHLTQWQAKFRRWYNHELQQSGVAPPQEVQKKYPQYAALVADLKMVNKQLVEYTAYIKRLAHGE